MGNVELHKSVLDLFVNEANKVSSIVAKEKGLTILDTHKKLEKEIQFIEEFDSILGDGGALHDLGIRYFIRLGVIGIRLYCARLGLDSFKEKADELHDIYKRKNNDYGNSFEVSLDKYGVIAAVVRLQDKVTRYVSLTTGGNKRLVADEKVEDTLLDLVNYCVMTVMYYEALFIKYGVEGVLSGLICTDTNYSIHYVVSERVTDWVSVRAYNKPFEKYNLTSKVYFVERPATANKLHKPVGYFVK